MRTKFKQILTPAYVSKRITRAVEKQQQTAFAVLRWMETKEECARVVEYNKCKMHIFAAK